MRKLLLLLLLDAFRPDYLQHARFLRTLAAQGATGRLREPFGFAPRSAYFGGLDPEQSGFSNMFWFDRERSPFGLARFLRAGDVTSPEYVGAARAKVEEVARSRTTPYAATYLSSLDIPLDMLHYFDVCEKRAPWDLQVGYHSLFAILQEQHLPWFQCSWPTSNTLYRHGDAAVLEHTLSHLQREHRFAYVHLGRLDELGHSNGPGSLEMLEAIQRVDVYVQKLVEHCYELYDVVDMVIFADHGMVNVVKTIDVWGALRGLGLSLGDDYVCFLDSTMARFWFGNRIARRQVQAALSALPGGRVLEAPDLEHFKIAGCDPRNGELYFLADPGGLIFPNFFQMSGTPVKGMHGYDPDSEDNQGIFILNAQSRLCRGFLGVVDATQIFPTCLDLLEVDVPESQPTHSALRQCCELGRGGQYMLEDDPGADAEIGRQLGQIIAEVNAVAPDAEAVILTGGFGRGEGSIVRENGHVRPLNDYDLLLISRQVDKVRLKAKGQELATRLGLDYVDLGAMHPDYLSRLNPTLFVYDLKYGSQVIDGDPLCLERLPDLALAQVPLEEALILLFNRCAGLLLGLPANRLDESSLTGHPREFLVNQVVKALMAIGDWYLFQWQGYDTRYATRRYRFAVLGQTARLPQDMLRLVDRAYSFKLAPDFASIEDARRFLFETLPWLEQTVLVALQTMRQKRNGAGREDTLKTALGEWCSSFSNRQARELASLRAAVALTLFSIEGPGKLRTDYLLEAGHYAARSRKGPVKFQNEGRDPFAWYRELRETVVESWEAQCHS